MPRLAPRHQHRGFAVRLPPPTSPGRPSLDLLAAGSVRPGSPAGRGVDATAPCGAGWVATARLLVTAGPSKGIEFAVAGPVTTVGRGTRNAVVISDISVSRGHFRLERRGRRWVLVDGASGNGTCVNGHLVRRRPLRDGDEIEIGDTTLRFLEPGGMIVWRAAAPEGSARSLARRRRACLQAAAVVAVVLVVAAAFVRRQRVLDRAEAEERRDGLHALARQKLEEGIALLKEQRRGEARTMLMVASELDGSDAEIARALASFEASASAVAPAVEKDVASAPAGSSAATPRPSRPSRWSQSRVVPAAEAVSLSPAEGDGRRALAERHLLAARELQSEEDLPRAAALLRSALENDPENTAALLEMERVVERIREVYLRSYVAKDDEPEAARAGFTRVAAALPEGDELAGKATRWLERLDARRPR